MLDLKYRIEGKRKKKQKRKQHGRHNPTGVEGRDKGPHRGRVA
jgi:hypothetical protein